MGVPLLPNPYTSLAWLPANIASQLEAGRYICCVVVGVSVISTRDWNGADGLYRYVHEGMDVGGIDVDT